jgi:peptidoglycan/LPS O-acetylase OafA/YrhL
METKPLVAPTCDTEKLVTDTSVSSAFLSRIAKAWDIKKNFHSIFHRPKGSFEVLDGLRAICFFTVVVGHTFGHYIKSRVNNYESQKALAQEYDTYIFSPGPLLVYIYNASFVIDIFFSLSGFLIAAMLVREYQRSKNERWYLRIDVMRFVLRRWVRLLPTLLFAMAVFSLRWYYAAEGAIDNNKARYCKEWWWTVFLMNNTNNTCMSWTWTLGIEFKFYILSIPLVLLTMKYYRLGMSCIAALAVGSVITILLINLEISSTVSSPADFWWENYKRVYFNSYTRWNPYLFGLVAGVMYMKRITEAAQETILACDEAEQEIRPANSPSSNVLLYFSYILVFVVLFGLLPLENYRWYNMVTLHLFESLSRTLYGAAISYIIYMCLTGYMKPLNYVLSSHYFFCISQLTYSGYLLHPLFRDVVEVVDFTVTGFTPIMFISLAIAGIIFVLSLALPAFLLIEKPFVNLRPV